MSSFEGAWDAASSLGPLRFELESADLPFARIGRGRRISDDVTRLRVRQLISDAVDDIAKRVQEVAKFAAPHKTGNLVEAIERDRPGLGLMVPTMITREPGAFPTYSIVGVDRERAPYAAFVHEGTGIFPPGGTGNLIRPRTAKFMVFEKEGVWHFEKEVRGQKAQPFMREAVETVDATYAPARVLRLKEQLGNLAAGKTI